MPVKILIVDDELDLQDLMKRKFRREIRHGEFSLDFATDGQAALDKVRADTEIDLVISDINMPGMDGLALLDYLAEFDDRLRTIIISAYGDMDNIRTAMNRGAFDFVTKPIDFPDLLITIKKTLDQLDVLREAIEHRMAAERARGNLARYFPAKLVDTLAARDEPFGPPRQQNVGVLFADIRDFTTLSESMTAAEVMELLREFHGLMESAVFEHGGTLDKYIGDECMATFGTPDTGPNDAANALTCARAMLKYLEQWNEERSQRGDEPIGIGIGVHYGPVVLGDIGSERAMEFAVIGDTVNIASRLQGLTRTLDTDLVVSEAAIDQARAETDAAGSEPGAILDLSQAGAQPVKGRSGQVEVFVLPRAG
jgi:adenylate cyclase